MALKPCKECGHDVSNSAQNCPNCGAPVRMNLGCGTFILSFLAILFIIGVFSSLTKKPSSQKSLQKVAKKKIQPKPAACSGIDGSIFDRELVELVENGYRDIYVKGSWYFMNLTEKKNVATYFATCRSKGEFSTFYDARTGKKLAKYGKGWGYSNYED